MKKQALIVLLAVIAVTTGFLIKVPIRSDSLPQRSVTGWIHLQKLILPFFENVCEDSTNPTVIRLAQEFDPSNSSGAYLKQDVLANLRNLTNKGLIPKGEIFKEYNDKHLNELQVIFEVLYYAKDFDTFYKAAAWARQTVNCGLFIDAIYLAIKKRRDTERLSVPPPYEILPNYFVRKDVVLKISTLLYGGLITTEDVVVEGNSYIVTSSYTGDMNDYDEDSKLAYFHEDMNLNSYYFLQRLDYAPWFNSSPNNSNVYGEYLYHTMKQLTIRYDLERYANNLPELDVFDWYSLNVKSYDSMLIYANGDDFGRRLTGDMIDVSDITFLKNIEDNIDVVINHMISLKYTKTEILNTLMEIFYTGDKSYETIAHRIIDGDVSDDRPPTVMAHYMTSLRDPIFWKLNKKIVNIIEKGLKQIPGYTKSELVFPGVEIVNVDVKKVQTTFDNFIFDTTDAFKSNEMNTNFQVKVGQPQLDHKPFSIKLNISSRVSQKGLVKLYLGPKVTPGLHVSKKHLFMLLDSFECDLKIGTNVISRSSEESLSEDFNSLAMLRKQVEDAEFGLNVLPLKHTENIASIPSKLLLPKGTPEGLPLQIFAFIAPFVRHVGSNSLTSTTTDFNSATLSLGYPLDLDIDAMLFQLPNSFVKDIVVTHKGDGKMTKSTEYGGKKYSSKKPYDPMSNLDDIEGSKEDLRYNSKREPFAKNTYSSKLNSSSKSIDYSTIIQNYSTTIPNIAKIISSTEGQPLRAKGRLAKKKFSSVIYQPKVQKDQSKQDDKVITLEDMKTSEYNVTMPLKVATNKSKATDSIDHDDKNALFYEVMDSYDDPVNVDGYHSDNFPHLLEANYDTPSSRPNNYSKRKERFDYKSKIEEYKNKKNIHKELKTTTEEIDIAGNIDADVNNFLPDNNTTHIIILDDLIEKSIDTDDDIDIMNNEIKEKLDNQHRMPSVYDYLFPYRFDYDDNPDSKVYE